MQNGPVEPILNEDELEQFKQKYADIYVELLQLFISLPLFIISLDKKILDCDFSEIKHVDAMPKTYECMCMLLKYDEANLIMLLPSIEEL